MFLEIEAKDWATIVAALLGPILAVQAQKAVEAYKERRTSKFKVFEKLMATRASTVSVEHVQALNMIDLVFFGSIKFGFHRRSRKEQLVLDAWKEYLDHLNTRTDPSNMHAIERWAERKDNLFIEMLYAMSQDVGYKFDKVQLKRGAYSPMAHEKIDSENEALRQATLAVLAGKQSLNMNVTSFPFDPEATIAHKLALENVGKAFGDGALRISVAPTNEYVEPKTQQEKSSA
jgi:hypothetical protein